MQEEKTVFTASEIHNRIIQKENEIAFLKYEEELLKQEYVKAVKNRTDFSYLIDYSKVIDDQPEKPKKKYNYPLVNTYNIFMNKMRILFKFIWSDISIRRPIMDLNHSQELEFFFSYRRRDFCLTLPNFHNLTKYENALNICFSLSVYKSQYVIEIISKYSTWEDMECWVLKDVMNYIEETKND